MTLWSIRAATLLLSCDLGNLDDFTKGLLCNDAVIKVNQDAQASPAKRVYNKDGWQIWTKELSDGSIAVGVFNLGNGKRTLPLPVNELKLDKRSQVTDLWKNEAIGKIIPDWNVEVNPHGAAFFKIN